MATQFPEDQITELKAYCSSLKLCPESNQDYFLLEELKLPEICGIACCDALLCPTEREGYPSRLFFDQHLTTRTARNWNADCVRIVERNWFAISWRLTRPDLSLAEMVVGHLRALTDTR